MLITLPDQLSEGDRIDILQPVPLMSEINPLDVFAALTKARKIDGCVAIVKVDRSRTLPWIKVRSLDVQTREMVEGWINTIALLGKNKFNLVARDRTPAAE